MPKPIKPQTNIDRLTYLMEYSKAGPLMQAFVITAIEKYATLCLEAGAKEFDTPMLNGEAWIRCAEEAELWVIRNYGTLIE